MAINLWEAAGRSTSYNPLPNSNMANIDINKDYELTFKAKSPTGAEVRVSSYSNVNDIHTSTVLTSEFIEYKYTWRETEAGLLYIQDKNSVGNIQIKDINLVEKPLGRATVNGIDGFLSGKWTLHANAKAIDNETLELNATGIAQHSNILLNVEPYTDYIVSTQQGKIGVFTSDLATSITSYSDTPKTFNSGNRTQVRVAISNDLTATGKFTFIRPILNLGTTPAPYEPKRGERMVMPEVAKNLFYSEQFNYAGLTKIPTGFRTTGYANNGANLLKLKPSTTYTFSAKVAVTKGVGTGAFGRVALYDGTIWLILNPGAVRGDISNTFTTPADLEKYVYIYIYGSSTAGEESEITNIQIEEGSTATPFEPYRMRRSRKPNPRPKVYKTTANFAGKVSGSTVENPHIAKRSHSTSLLTPSSFSADVPSYDSVSKLDGSVLNWSRSDANGTIAQQLFSFDVISEYERKIGKIPASTVADKVTWLKGNIDKLTANWHGFGSGPAGNKATVAMWDVAANAWVSAGARFATTSNGSVTKLSPIAGSTVIIYSIDSNGFFHALAYAEASNGVTASQINTDYVELEIETKEIVVPGAKEIVVSRPARKGLEFGNDLHSIQLPTLSMDTIEIDCIIDSTSEAGAYFLDARDGASGGYIWSGGGSIGPFWSELAVDDVVITKDWTNIPKDKRIKFRATGPAFTDDITLFGYKSSTGKIKIILFGVKCYSNGAVVAEYDFTDPKTTTRPGVAKAKTGPNGTITGNPVQLNKQAFR